MGERDYLKRLEQLNGGPLRHGDRTPAQGSASRRPDDAGAPASRPARTPIPASIIRYQRDLPRAETPQPPIAPTLKQHVVLEEAVSGYAVRAPELGNAFKIKTTLREAPGHWDPLRAALLATFLSPDSPALQRFHARCGVLPQLDDLLFFDLETTGLSQTPLFLIGAMAWEGDDLVIRQYLARHYGEESAVLSLFLEQAREKSMLVSFNGKSFDLPYVRMRAITHGVPCILHVHHFDLLHESRRVWRSCLPNCKLQTLEQHVCGHPPRVGDIPGALIPEAYHAYVRTGNAAQIVQILQHNLIDLITLAELLTKLPPLES